MSMILTFVDTKGETLFSNHNAQSVPRAGDQIVYTFNIHDEDEWNQESLREHQALHGRSWRVMKVVHEFGRHEIKAESHRIFITLAEAKQ